MRIITYNVNGIRAALGKGFIDWVKSSEADVICIQETKARPEQIPTDLFNEAGYYAYWFSAQKKGYSGVGILTKKEPDNVVIGMGVEKYDNEGRVIRADYGDVSVMSVYHPSGTSGNVRQEFKMTWLDDFLIYSRKLKKERPNIIISGDFNICHKPIDIHDPIRNANNSGFLPEEREWIGKFIEDGFIDSFRYLNQEPHNYTWWSYRTAARTRNVGWRIDYHCVNKNLKDRVVKSYHNTDILGSDHCPVSVIIN